MKIKKFVFKKYKLILFFILIIFANQSVYSFTNSFKNKIKEKNNKVYYKNKFFDELDHPVIIEKSEKRKNYIKPNIVIPKSNYKTVAKNIDERDLLSLDFKEGSNKFFYKDNRDEIDKKVISSMKEIVFDSDGNKNFPDISSYKSADILKDGKEIIQLPTINENKSNNDIKEIKQSNNLSNLDKFRQIDISTDNKIDALELNKNKSVVDDKGKENVYFAENDIDYLINKKLRESSDAKDFTRINLKNKIEKLDLNIHKNENSEWMNKLDELNKELMKNLKDNPSQYKYYIDEFKYDVKELLFNKDIINIGITVKKDYYDENIPELMNNEFLTTDRNKNVDAIEKVDDIKIKEEKDQQIEVHLKTKTNQNLQVNKLNSENSGKNSKSELKEKELNTKSKIIAKKLNDINNKEEKTKNSNLHKFKEIEKEEILKIKTSEKKSDESNRKNKIDIEKEGIDKNSLLAELLNSLE